MITWENDPKWKFWKNFMREKKRQGGKTSCRKQKAGGQKLSVRNFGLTSDWRVYGASLTIIWENDRKWKFRKKSMREKKRQGGKLNSRGGQINPTTSVKLMRIVPRGRISTSYPSLEARGLELSSALQINALRLSWERVTRFAWK